MKISSKVPDALIGISIMNFFFNFFITFGNDDLAQDADVARKASTSDFE